VRIAQTELDRRAKRSAPIHTHGFDRIGITQPFKKRGHLFQFASRTDLNDLTSISITKNRIIHMSFPAGKFINAQKTGRAKRLLFIEAEPFLLDFLGSNGFKTLPHKTRTNPRRFRDMLHGLSTGKPADFFSPSCGRPPSSSTSSIRFGKAFSAREASEASFVKNQFHLMLSQRSITLLSLACIMDFHTPFLTRRANRLGRFGDHLDPDGAIRLPFLVQNMQFAQV
jgi:hypothetical protein